MDTSQSKLEPQLITWRRHQNSIAADVWLSSDYSNCEKNKCVILLHGWMGQRGDLCFLAPLLVKLGYCVIALDLPYHGQSESEVLSCPEAATLVSESIPSFLQCDEQNPLSVVLVGYSLGGRIAFEIATLVQKKSIESVHVQAVVLISSAAPARDASERNECKTLSQKRYEKLLDSNFSYETYEDWLKNSWYAAELWGNIREKPFFSKLISDRVHRFNERSRLGWALAAKHMCRSTMTSLSESLHCPVLFFFGTCDSKYSAMASELQQICSNFRYVPIEGAGHNIPWDSPGLLAFHITAFLADNVNKVVNYPAELSKMLFTRYSVPLNQNIVVGGHELTRREGVVVALLASSHQIGIGDICPLPGLHEEDIDYCIEEVRDLSSKLQALQKPMEVSTRGLLEYLNFVRRYSPVSRNGFEAAFVHLLSEVLHQPLSTSISLCASFLLRDKFVTSAEYVDMNGVLPRISTHPDSQHESTNRRYCESVQMSPFRVMKLKVGACMTIEEDVENVRIAVSTANSSGKRIRLDANRAWTISQYEKFETLLEDIVQYIEYIEEPFRRTQHLFQFLAAPSDKSHRIPVALDESLVDNSIESIRDLVSSKLCRTLILKPSVLGSLRLLCQLVCLAERHECEVVFTTAFESGIGTAWISTLASVLGSRNQYHGLGTLEYMESDVVEPSFGQTAVNGNNQVLTESCENFLRRAASSLFECEVTEG